MRRSAVREAGTGTLLADGAPATAPGPHAAAPGPGAEPAALGAEQPVLRADVAAHHAEPQVLQTEFPFQLPRGYVDESGTVHRDGVMRLATARDELIPLRDVRVMENSAFLSVVLLGRVITRLGTLAMVHDGVVENMFAADLAFLQDFYRQINAEGRTQAAVECPHCAQSFEVELGGSRLGES